MKFYLSGFKMDVSTLMGRWYNEVIPRNITRSSMGCQALARLHYASVLIVPGVPMNRSDVCRP